MPPNSTLQAAGTFNSATVLDHLVETQRKSGEKHAKSQRPSRVSSISLINIAGKGCGELVLKHATPTKTINKKHLRTPSDERPTRNSTPVFGSFAEPPAAAGVAARDALAT